MELLGGMGHVESCFDLFGHCVSVGVDRCTVLCQMYHRLRKSFLMDPMELLGDVGNEESCFNPFRDGVSVLARKVHGLR
jgi:hypothetical protein